MLLYVSAAVSSAYAVYALLDAFYPFWEADWQARTIVTMTATAQRCTAAAGNMHQSMSRAVQNLRDCDSGCKCEDCQKSRATLDQLQVNIQRQRQSYS